MYENSKIISFAISFADGMEKAYRNSYFCKWAKSMGKIFENTWSESVMGQIINSYFNLETHRNSMAYKLFTKQFKAFLNFLNDKLSLEQGISESKYIALIKKSNFLIRKTENNEGIVKAILLDSFFVRCLYEFWEGMD